MVVTCTDVATTLWLSKWIFVVDQQIGNAVTLWLSHIQMLLPHCGCQSGFLWLTNG